MSEAAQKQLLADLNGDGAKLFNEASVFAEKRYGLDLCALEPSEQLMVLLAAIRLRGA